MYQIKNTETRAATQQWKQNKTKPKEEEEERKRKVDILNACIKVPSEFNCHTAILQEKTQEL
jgi:hypothetical protein